MPAIINENICDHADVCKGIEVCPTGAFYYDKEKDRLRIDDSKCNDCEACLNECPIGAIRFCKKDDIKGLERIMKEIEEDSRTLEELRIDRYGAQPIDKNILLDENDVDETIKNTKGILLIEFNKDIGDNIRCLLHSIPVIKITSAIGECIYKKVLLDNEAEGINIFPSLLVVVNGARIGIVEDYYDDDKVQDFLSKINEIIQ